MSSDLLPPTIQGPVSVFSSLVTVLGVVEGTTVQLYQMGMSTNRTGQGNKFGVAYINLAGLQLTAGDELDATQSDVTGESDHGPREKVADFPTMLAPPAYLSLVHELMDSVLIGGVTPGTVIEIRDQNQNLVATQIARDTVVPVEVFGSNVPLVVGATRLSVKQILVWQNKSVQSPATLSLLIAPVPLKDRKMPQAIITDSLSECETAVPVAGIVDGASVWLEAAHLGQLSFYYGRQMWVRTHPLVAHDAVMVIQQFMTGGIKSQPWGPATVLDFALQPPQIASPVCIDAPAVSIAGLTPGFTLLLYAGRMNGNQLETAGPWKAGIISFQQDFPLPKNLQGNMSGPPEFLFAEEVDCKGRHVNDAFKPLPRAQLIDLHMDPTTPGLGPLVECSSYVRVSNLQPGVTVDLTSDQKDSPQLAPKNIIAQGPILDIGPTYRPLRAGEMVTATVSPCGSGRGSSATTQVQPLTSLAPPQVYDPTYAFQTTVQVDNCVPGAQVYLFVNEAYRNMATSPATSVQIPCGDLNSGDRLRALQALCQQISELSEPIVQVKLGEMTISQSPNPIITGSSPQQVIVSAAISAKPSSNPYNGQPVDAEIIDVNTKQKIGETNKSINRLFPYFYDGSKHPYTVSAPKFNAVGPVKFITKDPAPKADFAMSPSNPQYTNQPVYFSDQSTGAIQQWRWDFSGGPTPNSPSSLRNPVVRFSHSYTPITVKLTVTGPSGSDSKTRTFGTLVPSKIMQNQNAQCETVQILYCPNDINTPNAGDHATLSIYVENKTKGTGPGQPTTLQNGYVGGAYGYAGVCGWGQGSQSVTITLDDSSLMHIRVVDNNNVLRGETLLWGKKGAGTLLWGID